LCLFFINALLAHYPGFQGTAERDRVTDARHQARVSSSGEFNRGGMKNVVVLVVLCTIVVTATWLVVTIDPFHVFHSWGTVSGIQAEEPDPMRSTTSSGSPKKTSRPAKPRPSDTPVVARGDAVPEFAATAPPAKAPSGSSRKPNDIYGDATLSVTTVDGGHNFETLVYARDGGRAANFIRLDDGKVLSASSEAGTSPMRTPVSPDPTPSELATTAETPAAPPVPLSPANPGTCGEYHDGTLIVRPCSEIPMDTAEWLAKGSAAKDKHAQGNSKK
jgi:hypothetical protein